MRPNDGIAAGYGFGPDTSHNILYSQTAAEFANRLFGPSLIAVDRTLRFRAETHAQLGSAWHYSSASASFVDSVGFQVDARQHARGLVHTNAGNAAAHNSGSGAESNSGLQLQPWTALTITADTEAFVNDVGVALGEATLSRRWASRG